MDQQDSANQFQKYRGDWRVYFIRIPPSGDLGPLPAARLYHFETIDNDQITVANDDEGKALTGKIRRAGRVEIIRFNRTDQKRHFRGINAFEHVNSSGNLQMVLVGERRGDPFPEDERAKEDVLLPPGQEDGVWIATKP